MLVAFSGPFLLPDKSRPTLDGGQGKVLFALALIPLYGLLAAGCVSQATHAQALAELEARRAALDQLQKQSVAETEALTKKMGAEIEGLQQEQVKLANQLLGAQSAATQAQEALAALQNRHESEQEQLLSAQRKVGKLQEEKMQVEQVSGEMRRERDLLKVKADDLDRQLETARQDITSRKKAQADANARIAALEKDKEQLTGTLTATKDLVKDQETKLAAEQAKVAALREDKQKLMTGTTTAQDEIARLQKRAGELETQAARVKELEKRLSEQDQDIGHLRQAASDRETQSAKVGTLTDDLDKTRQRVATLTSELKTVSQEAAHARQERDRLREDLRRKSEERDQLALELRKRDEALTASEASVIRLQTLLQEEEKEKARLVQERAAKEAEIQRLTKTREDLAQSLEAEIAKGDIRIQQVRDQLTINMVDRVLFDSGKAQVKPAGLKVLKRVGDILAGVKDKQIRIEGHTDNVPIGPRLKEQFPTNWELSTARATSVVRYLIEEGGVERGTISAIGYADTRPVAGNDTEEGQAANRRIEIVLYPKNLSEIANRINP